jgi:hypothetical protein
MKSSLEESGWPPLQLLVADHTGAFAEYRQPLEDAAPSYARPVTRPRAPAHSSREFAERYLAALRDKFVHIQEDYRKRRRAFDTLFKHAAYDPNGSFAFRWECVLRRLDQTNPIPSSPPSVPTSASSTQPPPPPPSDFLNPSAGDQDPGSRAASRPAPARSGGPSNPRKTLCPQTPAGDY